MRKTPVKSEEKSLNPLRVRAFLVVIGAVTHTQRERGQNEG